MQKTKKAAPARAVFLCLVRSMLHFSDTEFAAPAA